jgi:hypothetical protein
VGKITTVKERKEKNNRTEWDKTSSLIITISLELMASSDPRKMKLRRKR